MAGYPADLRDTYLDGTLTGTVGAALSVIVEGPDQGLRALSGREYEKPAGLIGRIRRDVPATIDHLFKGELVRAASAGFSVVSGDLIMDGYDAVTGKHQGNYSTAA